jgi:hypothetical protein
MSPQYDVEQYVIKTGASRDHGMGWCAVVEHDQTTDLYGVNRPSYDEQTLLSTIASVLHTSVEAIKDTKVSEEPSEISMSDEYLI